MRKIIAVLLSVAMLATMSVTAFAAEPDEFAGSGQSEVFAHVYSHYQVNIPATIDLQEGNLSFIKLTDANIEDGYSVKVFCTNTDVNGIRLKHETKENTFVICSIFNSNGELCDDETPMATFTKSDVSENSAIKEIRLEPETWGIPGNYSGTLTYSFSCTDN